MEALFQAAGSPVGEYYEQALPVDPRGMGGGWSRKSSDELWVQSWRRSLYDRQSQQGGLRLRQDVTVARQAKEIAFRAEKKSLVQQHPAHAEGRARRAAGGPAAAADHQAAGTGGEVRRPVAPGNRKEIMQTWRGSGASHGHASHR